MDIRIIVNTSWIDLENERQSFVLEQHFKKTNEEHPLRK